MPYRDALKLIKKAQKQNQKEMLFDLYASAYPHMTKENYMTFEDFLEKSTGEYKNYNSQSTEELMAEIEEIEEKFKASK